MNSTNVQTQDLHDWREECSRIKKIFPRRGQLGPEPQNPVSQIHSGDVIDYLNQTMAPDALIGTDVGAALLTGHYMYEQSGTRRFFTSQGLGEMGFGLPGSIGAYFADTSRQIICLNTDGALMFNLQELQVVREHKDQKYLPRLATSKLDDGTFVSPPIEDMDPKIELSLLENLLGYKAHENSYKARGLT